MSGRVGREAVCSPAQERVGLANAPLPQARHHARSLQKLNYILSFFQCPVLSGLGRALGQCKSGQTSFSQLLVIRDISFSSSSLDLFSGILQLFVLICISGIHYILWQSWVVSKVPLNMNRDIGQFCFGNIEQVLANTFPP